MTFNNITILPGESGPAEAVRFVQFYMASTVDPASGLALRADTTRSQFNASKPAALGAVGDPETWRLWPLVRRNEETPGKNALGRTTDIEPAKTQGRQAPRAQAIGNTENPLSGRPVERKSRTRFYRP